MCPKALLESVALLRPAEWAEGWFVLYRKLWGFKPLWRSFQRNTWCGLEHAKDWFGVVVHLGFHSCGKRSSEKLFFSLDASWDFNFLFRVDDNSIGCSFVEIVHLLWEVSMQWERKWLLKNGYNSRAMVGFLLPWKWNLIKNWNPNVPKHLDWLKSDPWKLWRARSKPGLSLRSTYLC